MVTIALSLFLVASAPAADGAAAVPLEARLPPRASSPAASPPSLELELTDAATGRSIFSGRLRDGERAVLTWTNSLFRLAVTEVFLARGGRLELASVRYADPSGKEPPRVRPQDVDDLYQTGGPFVAEGLARPVQRVVFRVGEIGRPTLSVGDRVIRFADEVGFGGGVLLRVRQRVP